MKPKFNRHFVHDLIFHSEDRWADTITDTADMRKALRFYHGQTPADWRTWLCSLDEVRERLQRMAKHHCKLWDDNRQEYEVAKATREGRAGKLQRAMNLIFPNVSSGVADNAFWEQIRGHDADGNDTEEWHFVTDPERVEEEALRHVQNLFPRPMGWSPEAPDAKFPPGYAFADHPVVSPELAAILHQCDEVDFTGVLQPMTMDDFEQLLAQQTADSSPGM